MRRASRPVELVEASAEAIPLPDASIDTVVTTWTLCTIADVARALREMRRVLRPGGTLAFSLMHPCFSTKGAYWVRDEQGEKVGWVVSRYFDPGHWVERWRFTDATPDQPEFAVPRFDRTLSEYVNAVLDANRPLKSYYISEDEFRRREDLLRTLEAKPPVMNGRVRVVEIEGFDAQACGGTHVPLTSNVGRLSIFRTENKGRINKRIYVRLDRPILSVSPSGARELFW